MPFKLKNKEIKKVVGKRKLKQGDAAKSRVEERVAKRKLVDKTKDKSPMKACWKSHVQKGMKKKGNRMVPNCVPRKKK